MKDLNQIIDQLQDKMNELLDRWLRIPSVRAEEIPGAPFGRGDPQNADRGPERREGHGL